MSGRLAGKVALITGGGSGIGRASAMIFAREGARVVVSDIAVAGGEETVAQIEAAGGEAAFLKADISNEADVESLVRKTVEACGRLDCAFNNAGTEGQMKTTGDGTREAFDRTIAVNLTGVWLCMKHEIRQMLAQGGGAIVNASSAAGLVGFPGFSDYVASKHGVIGLTKTTALEYFKAGIRVNAVCPGVIQTPMVDRETRTMPALEEGLAAVIAPIGRIGQPAEVGETVAWLCSDAASYVTGACVPIDGGAVAA